MESRKVIDPQQQHHQELIPPSNPQTRNYVVLHLPFHLPTWDPPLMRRIYRASLVLLIITTACYILWPSEPQVSIVRLRLHHVRVHTHPHIALDISLDGTARVKNRAVYAMNYDTINVAIGYRGEELGHVTSGGGHVRAKGLSYVDTRVEFVGVKVVWELIYLVEDLARGYVQFDTVTLLHGSFGFSFFKLPLKAKISCEMVVNLKLQTLTRQNCYPELEDTPNNVDLQLEGIAPTNVNLQLEGIAHLHPPTTPSLAGKSINRGLAKYSY